MKDKECQHTFILVIFTCINRIVNMKEKPFISKFGIIVFFPVEKNPCAALRGRVPFPSIVATASKKKVTQNDSKPAVLQVGAKRPSMPFIPMICVPPPSFSHLSLLFIG